MGELSTEDMMIVGAFAPTFRSSTWLTLELGVKEFREARLASSDGVLAPLMVVLCDDSPDAIGAAMDHLVGHLGVRSIVASFDGSAQSAALGGARNEAFLLSPDGTFSGAPTEFYWYLGGDYRTVIPVYAPLLDGLARNLEERTQATGRLARIALLTGPGQDGTIAEAVNEELAFFGGVTREQLMVRDQLRLFQLSDDAPQERERAIVELINFAPDLVLAFAGGMPGTTPRAERAEAIGRLEAANVSSSEPRPLYVIGPRQAGDTYLDLLAASSESFRARSVVVDIEATGREDQASLRERFGEAFWNALSPSEKAAPRIYDALYYLVYATAAGRSRPVLTPGSIRQGLVRVTDEHGPVVSVGIGSAGLDLGQEFLREDRSFNLHGVTGSGAFDAVRQLRTTAPAIYCWTDAGTLNVIGEYVAESRTLDITANSCAAELVNGAFD